MHTVLGTKSYMQIFISFLFLIFASVILLAILNYYQFVLENIDRIIIVFAYVLVLSILSLLGYIIYMLMLPHALVSLDDDNLYLHKIGRKYIKLPMNDIVFVKANINIWAKPFLVYSSIEVETKDKKHYIRVAKNMGDLKDQLELLIQRKNPTY
jgi:hypothetical protein